MKRCQKMGGSRWRIAFAAAVLTLANFSIHPEFIEQTRSGFPLPLYILKNYGRDLVFLMIAFAAALLWAATPKPKLRRRSVLGFSALALFQFTILLKVAMADALARSGFIAAFSIGIFLLFAVLLNRPKKSHNFSLSDLLVAGALASMGTVVLNLCLVLLQVDEAYRFTGRLMGMSANPQNLSYFLAITSGFTLALLCTTRSRLLQLLCAATIAGAYYLVWLTGSRGPLGLMALNSLFFLFGLWRSRFSGAIFVAAIFAVPLALTSFEDPVLGERGDTRSYVWHGQFQEFLDRPVLGQPATGAQIEFGENSWLGAASKLGLVGFVLLLTFVHQCYPRVRHKKLKIEVEAAAARVAFWSIIYASMFEGIIAGFVNGAIFLLIFMLLAAGARPASWSERHRDKAHREVRLPHATACR